jgi:hypothetical protein
LNLSKHLFYVAIKDPRGGFGGFFFQSKVHALVPPAMLGMAWSNAFCANAEAKRTLIKF